jgi:hypothetical protein
MEFSCFELIAHDLLLTRQGNLVRPQEVGIIYSSETEESDST